MLRFGNSVFTPPLLGFGAEADIGIAVFRIVLQGVVADVPPILSAFGTSWHTRQQAGLATPFQELIQRCEIQHVAEVMRCDVGVREGFCPKEKLPLPMEWFVIVNRATLNLGTNDRLRASAR
ncbi:hypothetical protein ASD83_14020 [Devosia sp. Root685]|nr:hypothetical protein ASD83_14020 [Devosia sp. Root685]